MTVYDRFAERQIRKAQEEGAFENLAGAGKPLPHDSLEGLGPEARAEALALRAGGGVPPEVDALREIAELEREVEAADGAERARLEAELRTRRTQLSMLFERTGRFLSAGLAEDR